MTVARYHADLKMCQPAVANAEIFSCKKEITKYNNMYQRISEKEACHGSKLL